MFGSLKEKLKELGMVHGINRKRRNEDFFDVELNDEDDFDCPKRPKQLEQQEIFEYKRRPIRPHIEEPPGLLAKLYSWISDKTPPFFKYFNMSSKNPLMSERSSERSTQIVTKKASLEQPRLSSNPVCLFPNGRNQRIRMRGKEVPSGRTYELRPSLGSNIEENSSVKPKKKGSCGVMKYPFWKDGVKRTWQRTGAAYESVRLEDKEQYRLLLDQHKRKIVTKGLNDSFLATMAKDTKASPKLRSPAFSKVSVCDKTKRDMVDHLKNKKPEVLVQNPWQKTVAADQANGFDSHSPVTSKQNDDDSPFFLGEKRGQSFNRPFQSRPTLKSLPKTKFRSLEAAIWKPGVIYLSDDDEDDDSNEIEVIKEVSKQRVTDFTSFYKPSSKQVVHIPPYRRHTISHQIEDTGLGSSNWIQDLKLSIEQDCKSRSRKILEQKRKTEALQEEREAKLKLTTRQIIEDLKRRSIAISDKSESEDEEDTLQFPPITGEMRTKIEAAQHPNPPDEVLARGQGLQVTRRDMETLSGLNWLNDEIINYYFSLIVERGKLDNYPSCYAFNTFFYPRLLEKGHDGIKRWTKKVNIFGYDLVLIPVHLGLHWCLAVIDFKQRKIMYYDSMGGQNNECLNSLKAYLKDESKDKRKTDYDTSNWKLEAVKNIPQQMNGSDCGMFALKYGEYITRGAKITFTQAHMPYFRQRTVYEIIMNKIL